MSGILGHIQTVGHPLDKGRFKTMLDAMHLRGPDGEGSWIDQHVGLGHRMLRTTPEAHVEHLPRHDKEYQCVITSDARLDNRPELIAAIGRDCFKMAIIPDSAIILQAYLKWGRDCVHHLVGDFAFAVWDIRNQTLFCARDFLGVKPFNYCSMGETFLLCSDPSVIAKFSGLSFRINEARIGDSLTPHLEGYDTTSTFYEEIYRLPPAHTLELTDGNIRINKYWQPEPQVVSVYKTDDEYREALTEILSRAVADRCRGNEDPAIMLSGGVDSAAVMGVARNYCRDVSGGTVQSYSGIAEDITDCKESKLISLLSGSGDISSHLYSPKDLGKHIESVFDLILKSGEPFDIYMVLQFLLYQQAAKNGSRFMLDGVDGDLVTSLSYSYPVHLLRQFSFTSAWNETFRQSIDFFEGSVSAYKQLGRYFLSAYIPKVIKDWRWRCTLSATVGEILADSVAVDAFAKKVNLQQRLVEFERIHRKHNLAFPCENYLARVEHPYLTVGLERYDRVASLCSIEPRHPLLDRRLINFYKQVPWNQFMRQGWSKFLFRRVAEQFIPQEVTWRTGQEHVGYQFNKEMMERKESKIIERINIQYDILVRIVKPEFIYTGLIKDSDNSKPLQTTLQADVVGLTLWMYNNQELKMNNQEKKDYSKPTLTVLGKVSELTAGGSCRCGEGCGGYTSQSDGQGDGQRQRKGRGKARC